MKYWAGLVCFLVGCWLIQAGLGHRSRVRAERANGQGETAPLHNSLELLGDILPPFIIFILSVLAAKLSLAYFLLDGGQVFSVLDLGGLLFLLVGYGTWLLFKTRYRRGGAVRPTVAPEGGGTATVAATASRDPSP